MGIIRISHNYYSFHAFALMSTRVLFILACGPRCITPSVNCFASTILSPWLATKWKSKIFLLASLAEFVPHFQNRGAAPAKRQCRLQYNNGKVADQMCGNFRILIVAAVKICRLPQLISFLQTPFRHPSDTLAYAPRGAAIECIQWA